MRILACGDHAVLVEVDTTPLALRSALAPIFGIEALIPAAHTLLVRFEPDQFSHAEVTAAIEAAVVSGEPATGAGGSLVTVPVHYDGPDLDDIADLVGCSRTEVINRHAGAEYTVAFCGFAPGFAYLSGLDPRLAVARRASPRSRVDAGSIGIAGEYTAAYPRPSPGGWQLIGRTDATLWDLGRPEPALLQPGQRVRFEVVP